MNILWAIHLYPPRHCAGAEQMAHTINRYLLSKGHAIKVLHMDGHKYGIKGLYSFEGVDVFPAESATNLFQWCDIVLTHLDYTKFAIWQAAKYGKPCVHVTHNDIPYPSVIDGIGKLKVVHNSQWVADKLNYKWPSFVFPPPVDDWYKTEQTNPEYITLVNLNENKGANYFYSLAKKLPQYKFLGVMGSYENQIKVTLPNVKLVPNTPDIREIYKISKIVLMPSHYESWGRVASEAMLNGIPVIVSDTPGLKENVGKGGIIINRKETAKWRDEITKLMEDEKYYQKWAKAGKKRAAEQVANFGELEKFLLS
jgi:glycosyltransferase involved in cell wall biosynthesis